MRETQPRGSETAAKESTIAKDESQMRHGCNGGGDISHKDETKPTDTSSTVLVKKQFKRSRPPGVPKPVHSGVNRQPQSFQLKKQPIFPPRRYIDDPDDTEDQPDIPERRYVDSTSLTTQLSEGVPRVPSKTYQQNHKLMQGIRGDSNHPRQIAIPSQGMEKIYQPLIPPKSYKDNYQGPSSEYQSLTFDKVASNDIKPNDHEKELQLTNHSEGQYQALTKREEASPYEPLTFGTATYTEVVRSPRMQKDQPVIEPLNHSERQYQALTKREEVSPYEPLTFGTATNMEGGKYGKDGQARTTATNHSHRQHDIPRQC